ncbi:hypothetical protein [Aeromonas sp. Y318-1]|uniref:hypothetical protein n=1 Tax=Aeromonas TaxID=642 RepID=UPI0022E5000E|nr:hypothetical protein [Aeromonas sp. Y318-1]
MSTDDESFNEFDDIEWWNVYTKLYVQDIYCHDPMKRMASMYFRPQFIDAARFYKSCSDSLLESITYLQLSLLDDCCRAYHHTGRRPSQLFYKIEQRVIPGVTRGVLDAMRVLKEHRIDLVVDINVPSFEMLSSLHQRALYEIVDNGYSICIGGYDWRNNSPQHIHIMSELLSFIRVGPPPSNLAEVNHFIDTCFYIKERLGSNIIIDRIQSKTDLDFACRTPYFALMGDYISPPCLAKGLDNVFSKVCYDKGK